MFFCFVNVAGCLGTWGDGLLPGADTVISITLVFFSLCIQGNAQLVRGVVKGPDGKRRVGAEVFLVAPGIPRFVPPEVLEAKTDKRGRFRVTLTPGRRYWAWSHFMGSKGGQFASRIVKRVGPGEILLLQDELLLLPRVIQLKGLAPWGKPQGLKVLWDLDGREGFTLETAVDDEGRVQVPQKAPLRPLYPGLLPLGDRTETVGLRFVLQTKEGIPLFEGKVIASPHLGRVSESDLIHMAATIPMSIPCPQPLSLPLLLREKGRLRPLGGVQLFSRFGLRGKWYQGPRSDSNGKILLKVPDFLKSSLEGFSLSLSLPGYAGLTVYLHRSQCRIGKKIQAFQSSWLKEGLELRLDEDRPFSGVVRHPQGEGLGGAVIQLSPSIPGWTRPGRQRWVQSSKNGKFEASSLPANLRSLEASLFLDSKTWASLVGPDFAFPFPMDPILKQEWRAGKGLPREFEFDFALYHVLPFQALGPDGAPIPFPRVQWESIEEEGDRSVVGKGDRKGKGFLTVPHGKICLYGWAEGEQYFILNPLSIPEDGNFVLPPRKLVFKKVETYLSGSVVDKEGKPLKGAIFSILRQLENPQAVRPRTAAIRSLNQAFFRGRTDKNGHFSIPFFPDGALEMMFQVIYPGPPRRQRIFRTAIPREGWELQLLR